MAAGNITSSQTDEISETKRLNHPLLERCEIEASGEEIYKTDFSVSKHWVLDEHRLIGNPVIPGVAYFEMVRAALGERAAGKIIELRDILFVAPLRVRDDQIREVRLILKPDRKGFSFSVESDAKFEDGPEGEVRKYAMGAVMLAERNPTKEYDIEQIKNKCSIRKEVFAEEEREDDLGPRWQNVKEAYIGVNEALVSLELAEHFVADIDKMKYHPALMDRAAGRAKDYLIEGVYLPVSYKTVRINGPVPSKFYSYARYRDDSDSNRETLTWDTIVMDEQGRAIVEIEGFSQKRVNDAAVKIKSYAGKGKQVNERYSGEISGRDNGAVGAGADEMNALKSDRQEMLINEGVEAFARIISKGIRPQVAVSIRDMHAWIQHASVIAQERILEETTKHQVSRPEHPRPDLQTDYVAPQNELERKIAAVWQEMLGMSVIGARDNFYELGGDSVQAIQIIARLNDAGLELTPQQFFQYQTISEQANIIKMMTQERIKQPATADLEMPGPTAEDDNYTPSDFPLAGMDEDEFRRLSMLIDESDDEL